MRTIIPIALLAAAVLLADAAAAAPDPALKCRRAALQGAAKLARQHLKALRKCEDARIAGKLPAATDCRADLKVARPFDDGVGALRAALDKACGGVDKVCGGADDLELAALGWPSACPELEGQGCGAPLASCADVATCAACLVDAAVTRAVTLVYEPIVPVVPKEQKRVFACQKALGAAGVALADKRLQVDGICLLQRLAGDHERACPLPGDGKAAGLLADARAKAEAKVCKACGGSDKQCGGGDDLAAGAVGFASACPGVGLCGGGIGDLSELVACFDCTAGTRADCALAAAAPAVAAYPAGCSVAPPTPTPTVTPTATATPLTTASASATPAPTATPVFCPAAGTGTVTTAVTITLVTGTPIGSGDMDLVYLPDRVRLPGAGGDAAVTTRVSDLTGGELLAKGSPNNQDGDADLEPDRVHFTMVAGSGLSGAILKVTFDRCASAALTTAGDFVCALADARETDGLTLVPGASCTVAVEHAP